MTSPNSGLLKVVRNTLVVGLICATGTLFAGNDKNFTYLALGDSVAFGLDVRLLDPHRPPPSPFAFIGYPETIASVEHLFKSDKLMNTSCPGETSSSFMTAGAPDYGCHSMGPDGEPPFKTWIGLRANYPGTQLSFAVSQLSENKHINLVTLGIGSNDILMLLRSCGTGPDSQLCVGTKLPGVLQTYAQNLFVILSAIRAHYNGTLVLVQYYSPVIALDPIAAALNSTTLAVGSMPQFHALFADGFTAFKLASARFGGDACQAGLLIRLSPTACDIHPSPAGRDLLAATVLFTLAGQEGNNQQGKQDGDQN